MAETREEQALYGDTCIHGTAIGTPGGFDILCHYCEMGYTVWLDKAYPRYYLQDVNRHTGELGIRTKFRYPMPESWEAMDRINETLQANGSDVMLLLGMEMTGVWVSPEDAA